MRHIIITFFAALILTTSFAQKLPYKLYVIDAQKDTLKNLSGHVDSLKFKKIIKVEYLKFVRKGYVLAEVIKFKNDSLFTAKISIGETYRWGEFNINNLPDVLLSKTGYNIKQFEGTQVDPSKLGKLLSKIIKESDYGGYPFASVMLDSVIVSKNHISAKVQYEAGPQIKYANIASSENDFVKSSYLESYLGIREGHLFDSRKIDVIAKKMENLSYCKLKSSPKIKFENKSCKVWLDIKPVKANKVDAMVGLAPNQLDNNKMLATGYVKLDLHNLFRSGKRLTFNWSQFGVQSQVLKARYIHTNLFKSVINIGGDFNLFKQDTSFLNRNFKLDIGYDNGSHKVNFTSNFMASSLLSNTNETNIDDLTLIDFNAQYYGIEFIKNELDYLINPTKGWTLISTINIGAKTILNTSFVPSDLYDSLETQVLQSNLNLSSELVIPISKLFVAYSKVQLATVLSDGRLFNNDLLRLGGVNSLRGFNELEIYSSGYALIQVEGRLLLSENSRLFGFVDWAYSKNIVLNYNDTFLGLGTGLVLDTPSGAFQLVYAVGKSPKQSLSLAESKIHFGYVARF